MSCDNGVPLSATQAALARYDIHANEQLELANGDHGHAV